MSTRWSVPRDWEGATVAVLAGGPSMCAEVADTARRVADRVIAINAQGIDVVNSQGQRFAALAPWADMLYAADVKWWEEHEQQALAFAGEKVTIRHLLPYPEVLSLEQSNLPPFDPRPTHVVSGGNSGYQAVHIAAQRGAVRILLCGFDMRDVNRRRHWFGEYSGRLNTAANYARWITNFENLSRALLLRGVRVLNCTPRSALRGIPFADLEDARNA